MTITRNILSGLIEVSVGATKFVWKGKEKVAFASVIQILELSGSSENPDPEMKTPRTHYVQHLYILIAHAFTGHKRCQIPFDEYRYSRR